MGSRRPRRSAAANWMRHLASEDFIVDEPLLKPRRSQQVKCRSCLLGVLKAFFALWSSPLRCAICICLASLGLQTKPAGQSGPCLPCWLCPVCRAKTLSSRCASVSAWAAAALPRLQPHR